MNPAPGAATAASSVFRRLLTGAFVVLAATALTLNLPGPSHPVPKDFGQYYVAGKLALRGQLDALYFVDLREGLTEKEFPNSRFMQTAHEFGIPETSYFIYPPWVGWLLAPLALLPPYPSFVLAYLLCSLAILAAFLALARNLPEYGPEAALATFAACAISPPFREAMASAQASVLILLLLALFGSALWRKRPIEAGACWALMTGLKLFPAVFAAYLLARREYRALAAGLGFGVVLAVLSLLAGGPGTNARFLQLVVAHMPFSTTFESNQSITGFALRLTGSASPLGWTIEAVPPAVAWGARLVMLVSLGFTLWLVARRRPRPDRWEEPLAFGMFSIWAFMVAPNAWLHHLVALAVPGTIGAAYLLSESRHRARHAGLWLGAWTLLMGHYLFQRSADASWTAPPLVLLASCPLYCAIALYTLLALEFTSRPLAAEVADR